MPAKKKAAQKKSAAKKPAAKKSAAKKPAAKKSAAKKSAAKKSAAKKSAAKKSAAKKSAAKKPAKTAARRSKANETATQKAVPLEAPVMPSEAGEASEAPAMPAVGSAAPAFVLPGVDGSDHSLADHAGASVVIYFYPKDDTPGCTVEACAFRDNMARVTAKGAVVYGVSRDSLKSHGKFKSKYDLNFTLLSDEDLTVHKAYGAWGHKMMYGKPVEGVLRSTFLIGPDGKIARAWPRVKVEGHVDDVMAALEAL